MEIEKRKDKATWATNLIRSWLNTSPENTLENKAGDKAWSDPLVGFSSGDDPYWDSFKEHVGPFHWTPAEAFEKAFPGIRVVPHQLTVISWVLPQTKETILATRKETAYPSERWARARYYGEPVNDKLRSHIVTEFAKVGIRAMAPVLHPEWSRMSSDKFIFSSKWSERHTAFVSGLGTFGLCDGLITPLGKAIRLGSIVAEIELSPTPRPYSNHQAYCLWFSRGICRKCVQRCPAGAISEKGHDKRSCIRFIRDVCQKHISERYGFNSYACGLCETGVPCESSIPANKKSEGL